MLGIVAAVPASAASGTGGTLIVGMTAGNLPSLDTQLAGLQGYEGYRFVGNSLYDGLTRFNLLQSTQVPGVIPDLATSWSSNADATVWTFKLRSGVTFQDGTPFNADAVIFNLDRDYNPSFPFYSAAVAAQAQTLTKSEQQLRTWIAAHREEQIGDRKSTRLNSSHRALSRMPSSA